MPASQSAVWAVLADFPNIADWNGGVAKSYATSDASEGLGAKRHCDLSPAGTLEETIVEWEPEQKMVVRIDSATKIPVKTGLVTFTIEAVAAGADAGEEAASSTTLDYRYETKWGLLGRLMGPVLDGQLQKGFSGFLADLEATAMERS